jgi:predicted N-acetyltransferase YhbS
VREVRRSGLDYLSLVTELLQRARLADPDAGLWEAADLQWWWRMPRASDALEQVFWLDGDGPVAAVVLTEWRHGWGVDPIVVPGIRWEDIWPRALEAVAALGVDSVDILVRDDDLELVELVARSGFEAGEPSGVTWMNAAERPLPTPVAAGFELVDRAREHAQPHPMRRRNGEEVATRLRQCSLYEPELDLAIVTSGCEYAGYALFWFDPVTKVGLLEPMRVEDAYQRRGLGRALLTEGMQRLALRGAKRLKVGYGTDAARALYTGAGFRITATSTTYTWLADPPRSTSSSSGVKNQTSY